MGSNTKKDEIIKVISKYDDLSHTNGWFVGKPICKVWIEDFSDEDTGETVSIERKQVLYNKGTAITPDLVSELLFHFQCGDIKEVEISNQCRAAYEATYGTHVYLAVAEIGPKSKKYKFIFSATSIPVAIDILKDYIELNFIGGYRIGSIKEFQTELILEDNLKKEDSSEEDSLNDDKFYQINALIQHEDGFEHSANVVVKTIDLDKALLLLNRRLESQFKGEQITSKLEEAKLINVDYIIDDEFLAAYKTE